MATAWENHINTMERTNRGKADAASMKRAPNKKLTVSRGMTKATTLIGITKAITPSNTFWYTSWKRCRPSSPSDLDNIGKSGVVTIDGTSNEYSGSCATTP